MRSVLVFEALWYARVTYAGTNERGLGSDPRPGTVGLVSLETERLGMVCDALFTMRSE
jgi:hypothetical protein